MGEQYNRRFLPLAAAQMRAHFRVCPNRPAASDAVARAGENRQPSMDGRRAGECSAGGCEARARRAPDERTLRNLPEAARSLTPSGPPGEELELMVKCGLPLLAF
jgi:hypothetical protein